MTPIKEATRTEVLAILHRYLDAAFTNASERPKIVEDRLADDGGYWTVPVTSPLENSDRFNYYRFLAEIESRILVTERVDIELIPATPPIAA